MEVLEREDIKHRASIRAALCKKNKFFAYYAVTTLCFDDNEQETNELKENELFIGFFETNPEGIMRELFQYNPPMDEIYKNKIGSLTQDKIDKVKRAAQRWLSCNGISGSDEIS